MAISKQRKQEVVMQYADWLKRSQGLVLTEYAGLTMKQLDELRAKVREAGGEFHVVKNTLGKVAFKDAGLLLPEKFLEGSTAVAFAFKDAPAMAKVVSEYAKISEFVRVKGGYLGNNPIEADAVKALADLPPLPVVRAQLLGTLMAPASKLARTLAEPARQLASVLKAYADKDAAPLSA